MIGLAWILLGLAALSSSDGSADTAGADRALEYQIVNLTKQFVETGDSLPCCAKVGFEYPEAVGGPDTNVVRAVNELICGFWSKRQPHQEINGNLDSAASGLLSNYRSVNSEFRHELLGWNEDFRTRIVLNEWPVLSLEFEWEAYTGGSHTNELSYLLSFDVAAGVTLSLDDLFVEGYRDSLNQLGESKLREMRGLGDTVPLDQVGYEFPDDIFQLNDNFCITREGLRFFFNEYEISGYHPGGTTILIPYKEITGLIRRDGPLARKFAD